MDIISTFINFILHVDKYIAVIFTSYGTWAYAIFFVIIFCETGLVVTPFLPGDSMLFIVGVFAKRGDTNLFAAILIFAAAAILGDFMNYTIGKKIGQQIYNKGKPKMVANIDKTQEFFDKYGPVTIIIARFMPIIRTFAPFVAGLGKMKNSKFLSYNAIGGILWAIFFPLAGYLFGGFEFVKNNFTNIIYLIIFVSLLPALYGYIKSRINKRKAGKV